MINSVSDADLLVSTFYLMHRYILTQDYSHSKTVTLKSNAFVKLNIVSSLHNIILTGD